MINDAEPKVCDKNWNDTSEENVSAKFFFRIILQLGFVKINRLIIHTEQLGIIASSVAFSRIFLLVKRGGGRGFRP